MTELTADDLRSLDALIQISAYQIRITPEGFRWECQGLISASFPTGRQALKSLANIAKLGELTT
jgi:hypothetical protein